MHKIFIVEDDDAIRSLVGAHLENWGFEVCAADNFQDVLSQFTAAQPQLVLMDIGLPFFNGFYWCSQIRSVSKVPIVFLSSASDNMNIVMAINMGADDFIAKPFDLNVLTAKVQAILRRTYDLSDSGFDVLERNGAVLNLNDFNLSYDGKIIELTKNEFRITKTLMENRGKVVSRETLMIKLWENDIYVEENTLTVNINRLRRKLEKFGLKDFIKTKTGSGYIIE